ncbi:alpha/beta fold hydrolase [Planctomycetota bacterium]
MIARAIYDGARLATRCFRGDFGKVPKELDAAEVERLPGCGVELSALRWRGDGEPILLVHGVAGSAWMWARLATVLRRDRPFDLAALDLRGHGESGLHQGSFTFEQAASDLVSVLDSLGWDRAHVVAHSFGGKVALCAAADAADRFRSLVLADPAPPRGLNAILRAFPGLIRAAFTRERMTYPDRESWERMGRAAAHLQHWDAADRRLWSGSFRRTDDGGYAPRLPQEQLDDILFRLVPQDLTHLLPRITCPVLLLRPTINLTFMPGELRQFGPLPDLRRETIWGEHVFPHTNPFDTARMIVRFIDSVSSTGRWERVAQEAKPNAV